MAVITVSFTISASAITVRKDDYLVTPYGVLSGFVEIHSSYAVMGKAGADTVAQTTYPVKTATTLSIWDTYWGNVGDFSSQSDGSDDHIWEIFLDFNEGSSLIVYSTHSLIYNNTYTLQMTTLHN